MVRIIIFFVCCLLLFLHVYGYSQSRYFIRISSHGLQTGVCKLDIFYKRKKIEIYLIGVIHLGEEEYFKNIQNILNKCDIVLYEGIGGGKINGKRSDKKENRLYILIKEILGLKFQLEEINYKSSWINADVKFFPINASQKPKKINLEEINQIRDFLIITNFMSTLFSPFLPYIKLFISEKDKTVLKKKYARFLIEQIKNRKILGEYNKGIIEYRNTILLKYLNRVMKRNILAKRIGILYGVGHITGIYFQIEKHYRIQSQYTTWLKAWKW